jgi:hypothetical protein
LFDAAASSSFVSAGTTFSDSVLWFRVTNML